MLVLMTPMLAPIVAQAGIDPIHFGLVFVLATMIGLITPPVGITMFITCQLAGITVNEFTRAVWRPFLALVLAVIVCALWPGLVLFLPNLVMGRYVGGPGRRRRAVMSRGAPACADRGSSGRVDQFRWAPPRGPRPDTDVGDMVDLRLRDHERRGQRDRVADGADDQAVLQAVAPHGGAAPAVGERGRVFRSATISTPTRRPSPRTSPTIGELSRGRSRSSRRRPMRWACSTRFSFSRISIVWSAAAQQPGCAL